MFVQKQGNCNGDINIKENGESSFVTPVLFEACKFSPYDPTQDIIFPPELKVVFKWM